MTGAVLGSRSVIWQALGRSAAEQGAGLGAEISLPSRAGGWDGKRQPPPVLDLGGAPRRTAGLSPSGARGRKRSDLDSPVAGATIIQVQGGGAWVVCNLRQGLLRWE